MEKMKLGYAREDFSPDKPVSMNSKKIGETVYQPICVTALSFSQGDTRVLLVCMDLRNIYKHFLDIVKPMVIQATGVPEDAIFFHSPHNHSSPDVSNQTNESVLDWRDRIGIPAILRAVKAAVADEKEVTGMCGGKTDTANISYVRRYLRADGTWTGIASANPSREPIVAHESEADPELRAVRINREGGKDVVLVSFQTHAAGALAQMPQVISADFVGPLRDKLEAEDDVLVAYLQGACGNTNCVSRLAEEKPLAIRNFEKVGLALADYTRQALSQAKPLALGKLQYRSGTLACTVNHTRDHLIPQIRQIMEQEQDQDIRNEMLQQIGIASRYERVAIMKRGNMGETEPMEIAALSIGDFAMTFAPLEMFNLNGKQLRDASPYDMTFNCGYSQNYRGYMPSHDCWPHGEYEVYMCNFLAGTGEYVVLAHLAQLQDMKNS